MWLQCHEVAYYFFGRLHLPWPSSFKDALIKPYWKKSYKIVFKQLKLQNTQKHLKVCNKMYKRGSNSNYKVDIYGSNKYALTFLSPCEQYTHC